MNETMFIRKEYWRSLLRTPINQLDMRLLPGHADELRAALRDALHEMEEQSRKDNMRWRGEWTGKW